MTRSVWICALAFVVVAGWLDWRSRRIPNWLTVPGLLFGLTLNTLVAQWPGAKAALLGAGLALGLLLPLVLLRSLGAGDWKLMGALGGFLGPKQILFVLFLSIVVAGTMAMIETVRQKRVLSTLANMKELLYAFVAFGPAPHPVVSLDNPGLMKLPFGVAAAIATVICFWLRRGAM